MFRTNDRQILLMAVVVLGATGLAAVRLPGAVPVGNAIGRVLAPVQRSLVGGANSVSGAIAGAREMDRIRDDNQRLQQENAQLVAENAKITDLIRENHALRLELSFARDRVDLDLTGASIIGVKVAEEPGNLRRTVKINVGERDRVALWMPVANSVGLIGRVVRTAPYWCDVLLITDPSSMVQARIARTRYTGIVGGTETGELVMRYLPQDTGGENTVVQVGDLVYSSGLSQRFPPMLLIGQVTEVRQSDEQTHQEAVVRPAVDFNALEVALVIRDWLPATDAERDPLTDGPSTEAP